MQLHGRMCAWLERGPEFDSQHHKWKSPMYREFSLNGLRSHTFSPKSDVFCFTIFSRESPVWRPVTDPVCHSLGSCWRMTSVSSPVLLFIHIMLRWLPGCLLLGPVRWWHPTHALWCAHGSCPRMCVEWRCRVVAGEFVPFLGNVIVAPSGYSPQRGN